MKLSDAKDLLIVAAILGAAYFLYKKVGAAQTVLTDAGSKIGTTLYDIFHPNQTGEMLYYTATFPDGTRHAIASTQVDANGKFKNAAPAVSYGGDGATYQLLRNSSGNLMAVRV